jgi:hypothetical protein
MTAAGIADAGGAVRQFFAAIENLASEARTSSDPRVLADALAVLERRCAAIPLLRFPPPGEEPFNASPADMEQAWENPA